MSSDGLELTGTPAFAGDLFLRLALTRRLVLEPDQADQLIAAVTATLEAVTARCELLRCPSEDAEAGAEKAQALVDAVFVEQVAPGQLDRALVELPKYIEAFRIARRPDVR